MTRDRDDKRHRQERRNDHLAQSRLRHDIDAGAVIGFVFATQNARLRGQLPAHFTHDGAGGFADRVHAERRENERQQAANKETDDDLRFVERELEIESVPACGDMRAKFLHVRTEKDQGRKAGRRDGVAFRDRFHRVADCVEIVSHAAHFLRQVAHDRDAAGVIRDRTEGVERDNDSGHREHAHDRDRDAVKTGEMKAEQDREPNKTDRQRGRVLSDRETGNDVGRVPGL